MGGKELIVLKIMRIELFYWYWDMEISSLKSSGIWK